LSFVFLLIKNSKKLKTPSKIQTPKNIGKISSELMLSPCAYNTTELTRERSESG